jgi:putative flippase GtrA
VLASQLLFYVVVGGLSACIDIGLFTVLIASTWPVLTASIVSFVAATIVNYVLSVTLAFARGKHPLPEEVLRFWLVALVGLAINALSVWILVALLATPPVAAKILAVGIVFAWNFLGRRLFVFQKDQPPPGLALARRLRARSHDPGTGASGQTGASGARVDPGPSKTSTRSPQ